MEILLLISTTILIVLLSFLTYTHHKTVKVLREDLDDLNQSHQQSHIILGNSVNTLHTNLEELQKNTLEYIDSKNKSLKDTLNDVIKEQEITINYNKEQISTLSLNVETLVKEIRKVEKGYKEKINY